MKQKYQKQNYPRLVNAIKRVVSGVHEQYGGYCYYSYSPYYFGMSVFEIAYKADKYDVLNAILPGAQHEVVFYARGDIRHRRRYDNYSLLFLLIITLFVIFVVSTLVLY